MNSETKSTIWLCVAAILLIINIFMNNYLDLEFWAAIIISIVYGESGKIQRIQDGIL